MAKSASHLLHLHDLIICFVSYYTLDVAIKDQVYCIVNNNIDAFVACSLRFFKRGRRYSFLYNSGDSQSGENKTGSSNVSALNRTF